MQLIGILKLKLISISTEIVLKLTHIWFILLKNLSIWLVELQEHQIIFHRLWDQRLLEQLLNLKCP